MGAFKRGDWIRMTEDDRSCGYKSGDVFRLTDISESGVQFTDNDGDARHANHRSSRFEPWTPKVGERVRFTDKCHHSWWFGPHTEHKDGVVTGPATYGGAFDEYEWDVDIGHAGSGNVGICHIEPLPVAAEAQPAARDDPAAQAQLTIQAGKFYKTRDGRKVGPMVKRYSTAFDTGEPLIAANVGGQAKLFRVDGGAHLFKEEGLDLISEWPADTDATTNVAATVDALDEEYGPVVAVADRDNDTVGFTVSLDTSELHEELDAVIAKLKKIRKLQRELGLIAA
ncbi:MAG: hypothetical protein H5U22_06645 [Rhizobium sp.]|nr:hypothetical protein [Rhizobium sp.]